MSSQVFRVNASELALRTAPSRHAENLVWMPRNQAVARLNFSDRNKWWYVFADIPNTGVFVGYAYSHYLRDISVQADLLLPSTRDPYQAPVPEFALVGEASAKTKEFIVEQETGGRDYYENVVNAKPVWPGYASGVTIGVGFDLGYADKDEFAAQWKEVLAPDIFARLESTIGLNAGKGDGRDQRVERLKALVSSLHDVRIPWDMAGTVFKKYSIPIWSEKLGRTLPNATKLPGDCFGALLSLIYNRGANFKETSNTRTEMAAIYRYMQAENYAAIPEELRKMKRVWPDNKHLQARRDKEAQLFEDGLALSKQTR